MKIVSLPKRSNPSPSNCCFPGHPERLLVKPRRMFCWSSMRFLLGGVHSLVGRFHNLARCHGRLLLGIGGLQHRIEHSDRSVINTRSTDPDGQVVQDVKFDPDQGRYYHRREPLVVSRSRLQSGPSNSTLGSFDLYNSAQDDRG